MLHTRREIVSAALHCAAEGPWPEVSMQAVRRRAGVSNGSLFHHFPRREDLTAAVVGAALARHQDALLAALDGTDAHAGVTGVVLRHLAWVDNRRAHARLFLDTPADVLRSAAAPDAVDASRAFFAAVAEWLGGRGWSGRPALPVVLALWIGPANDYARRWLAAPDPDPADLAAHGPDLADGAWAALAPFLRKDSA